ncbi:MAG TPA: hypothetical protein VK911_11190 [Vicinamibacterales bacterium]|nr:hypothetical protein [Vicinamibacterales bacterium]
MARAIALTLLASALLLAPRAAPAQHLDLTVFVGQAYPVLDGDLVLRAPSVPSLPGVDVTASQTPELRVDGGSVFAVAIAFGGDILGIEGRLDATDVGFDATGARYTLRSTTPPFQGLDGSVSIANGRFDVKRLNLLSLNLRLRTPGPIGLVASGGLSYLPDIEISGSVPLSAEVAGNVLLPPVQPRLRLTARPGESEHRWGVNAGAGVRVGGRVSLVAEARIFYFRDYQLQFGLEGGLPYLDELVDSIESFRFEPVFVNAQAGLSVRF